jgi:tetratricopeptide repeat protein 30
MPVVMGMAQIHWDVENWAAVEKVFKQSAEFCSDQDDWQLNVAHVLFREERWEEAIRYYLPLVRNVTNNSDESILKASWLQSYIFILAEYSTLGLVT